MDTTTTIILVSCILSAFLAIILFCINLKNIRKMFANSSSKNHNNSQPKKNK